MAKVAVLPGPPPRANKNRSLSMKKLFAPALVAVCMACAAVPVAAQPRGGGQGIQLRQRADQLQQRINRGVQDRSLDRREADRALGELVAVRRLEDDLLARDRGSLTQGDRLQVSARLDQLERSIHWLRTNDPLGLRADELQQRITRGVQDRSLDRREADRAQGELAAIRRLETDLLARDRGNLTQGDRLQVAARLDHLERSIHWLRTNDRVAPAPGANSYRYSFGRQFWTGAPQSLDERLDWLETRVRRGIESGSLTRGESDRAFAMLRDFRRTRGDLMAQHGGRLGRRDQDMLSMKLDTISQQIRWLQGNDRRY
jgi:hypothetical protein